MRIVLDEGKLAAYNLSPLQVAGALGLSNRRLASGAFGSANREYLLETGEFLRTAEDVRNVVAGVANGKPVFVRDVAQVWMAERSRRNTCAWCGPIRRSFCRQ